MKGKNPPDSIAGSYNGNLIHVSQRETFAVSSGMVPWRVVTVNKLLSAMNFPLAPGRLNSLKNHPVQVAAV